jgi:hypothetical protein
MAEVQIGPGDSLSKMLQVFGKEAGLKRIWTGDGRKDARDLVFELHNAQITRDQLWNGIKDLYSLPELKELPERVQAALMAIILHRRALSEMDTKSLAEQPKAQG